MCRNVVTTTAASTASGLTALRLSIGSASDPADLTSGNYSERFLLDVKDFKPEQDTWAFTVMTQKHGINLTPFLGKSRQTPTPP